MKTYSILFEHRGENSDTARDPVRVYDPQAGIDLDEERTCCLNWDDDQRVSVKRYAVHTVTLPDWLSPQEWIVNSISWKWAWGFGCWPDWPEAWQRFIAYDLKGHPDKRLAAVRLLKSRPRRPFRQSLREQLVAWLEAPVESRAYDSPFSSKQRHALLNPHLAREADRLDQQIYWYRPEDTGITSIFKLG